MYFSEREKISSEKLIVLNDIEKKCSNRLWNLIDIFLQYESNKYNFQDLDETIFSYLLDKFGFVLEDYEDRRKKFKKLWINILSWNEKLDSIEMIIEVLIKVKNDNISKFINDINEIFEEEKSAYRIIKYIIVPITSNEEIETISISIDNPYHSVNESIEKALIFYSDREKPDYKNSIKESITAVEAMCNVICGEKVELGKALGRLEKNGVYIHGAMKSAFSSLYGYTSDVSGVRHGYMNNELVTAEDAKYMLITCSAFINYLKEKYSKIKGD